jgi:hypothetical protein
VKVRATVPRSALCDREPAAPRPIPRYKRSVGTSHCAGASISYARGPREAGSYRFSRECFCLSPEAHGAQFLEGVVVPWLRGNA